MATAPPQSPPPPEPTTSQETDTSSTGIAPDSPEVKRNKRLVLVAGRGVYPVVRRLLEKREELNIDIEARYPPPLGILNHGKGQVTQLAEKVGEVTEVSYGTSWVTSKDLDLKRTALQAAADSGHEEIVKLLIENGANVNALPADDFGRTALQAAADGGHEEVVKLLIEKGANVNARAEEYYGMTALQAAAWGGYKEIVDLLIKHEANVNANPAEKYGRTALQAAAYCGHEDVVRLLIEKGAEVDTPAVQEHGVTALQAAAWGGHKEIVKLLIERKADVNEPPAGLNGRTALQAAAETGDKELVDLLIRNGAKVNAPAADLNGKTALDAAGSHRVVRELLEAASESQESFSDRESSVGSVPPKGDQKGEEDENTNKRLVSAAGRGDYEVVRRLLGDGAGVDARSPPDSTFNSGKSKMLKHANDDFYEFSEPFLQSNDQLLTEVKAMGFARTALQAAADGGHMKVVELLIGNGADINASPAKHSGRTALQAAAEGGHKELVELLIEKGAIVNAPPAEIDGRTALQAAAEGGHEKVMELLKGFGASEVEEGLGLTINDKLVFAAGRGYYTAVRDLLRSGAGNDINARCLPPFKGFSSEESRVEGFSGYQYQLVMSDKHKRRRPMYFARTALQAAAEGGHKEIVGLLIAYKADINALPVERFGRTALQAAAEGGYKEVAELLLEAGANVNGPPAREYGRTALQAAIESGNGDLVQLLIKYKADVNAPPAEVCGITALQAAAEVLDEEVLVLLIKYGVDLHRKNNFGQNILHEACEAGDVSKLDFLLRLADFSINEKDYSGSTPLPIAGRGRQEAVLESPLKKNGINAQDYSGSTPLHIATKRRKDLVLKLLLKEDVEMDIEDHLGETPLQAALKAPLQAALNEPLSAALKAEYRDIFDLLLEGGASANGLEVDDLCRLQQLCRSSSNEENTVTLSQIQLGLMTHNLQHKKWEPKLESNWSIQGKKDLRDWWRKKGLSICLLKPTKNTANLELFADPAAYFKPVDLERTKQTMFDWTWLIVKDNSFSTKNPIECIKKVPNSEEILNLKQENVLIGYACFNVLVYTPNSTQDHQLSGASERLFELEDQKIEISWIMRLQGKGSEMLKRPLLRSTHYRGTLNLKYLSIPNHAVDFFILLLDDVHKNWLNLLNGARECLSKIRTDQLTKNGKSPEIISDLLLYTQRWNKLRMQLKEHISKSKELLNDFRKHDILRIELMDSDDKVEDSGEVRVIGGGERVLEESKVVKKTGGDKKVPEVTREGGEDLGNSEAAGASGGDNKVPNITQEVRDDLEGPKAIRKSRGDKGPKAIKKHEEDSEEPTAIKRLSKKIQALNSECNNEISILEKETTEMIELEFNLVSIYEARKGIGMSASMKRLSWITFIFLPLMFASGLFGMNVDILDGNPSWLWFIVVAAPIMILIILVWVLYKYAPTFYKYVTLPKRVTENKIPWKFDYNENNTKNPSPSESPEDSEKLDSPSPVVTGWEPTKARVRQMFHTRFSRGRRKDLDEESILQLDSVVVSADK